MTLRVSDELAHETLKLIKYFVRLAGIAFKPFQRDEPDHTGAAEFLSYFQETERATLEGGRAARFTDNAGVQMKGSMFIKAANPPCRRVDREPIHG